MSKLHDKIGNFTTIPNTVIKMWAVIGLDAFALFTYLRYRTNMQTGDAFPSYDLIQNETGIGRRRIAKAIRVLEKNKLVERKKRFSQSTIYTLTLPPISNTVTLPLVTPCAPNKKEVTRTNKYFSPNGEDKPIPILAVLESHFSSVTSIPIPERDEHGKVKQAAAANKRWWTPLRYIANLVGGDEGRAKQLITDAVNQMRSNGKPLTISAPQSIEQVAISIFSKNGSAATVTKSSDGGFYA